MALKMAENHHKSLMEFEPNKPNLNLIYADNNAKLTENPSFPIRYFRN
jgi:hypothetical protein